jgi:hypothetical protein
MNLKQAIRVYYKVSLDCPFSDDLSTPLSQIGGELQKHMPNGVFILDDPSDGYDRSHFYYWVWVSGTWRWREMPINL